MPGYHGEIDGTAIGDLTDGTGSPALGQAGQQVQSRGIAKALKEFCVEMRVNRSATGGGQFRRRRSAFAYLRHNANIDDRVVRFKF